MKRQGGSCRKHRTKGEIRHRNNTTYGCLPCLGGGCMNGGVSSARGQETLKRHSRKMTVGPRDCQALQEKEDTAQRRVWGV